MAHELRTFHLFAGGGGGLLADLLLGHVPVGACEIEEYPRRVLLQRQRDGILPAFPIWDDIRTLDGKPWRGLVDIVAGGFPCTDLSSARTNSAVNGKQMGLDGKYSGLWSHMARFIGEVRPACAFIENSPNLRGKGLDRVLKDLDAMGYNARWGVLGAGDVGADHQRDRMWIVATDPDQPQLKGGGVSSGVYTEHADPCRYHWRQNQSNVERVAHDVATGLDSNWGKRLKAIGNGQHSGVAALAWKILTQQEATT